jgi:hypothetical protein
LLGRKAALNTVPFEELPKRYGSEAEEVFREFMSRLKSLVFYAAEDYLKRTNMRIPTQKEADDKMVEVFEEFLPQFTAGDDSTLLLRFAEVIRDKLDHDAFEKIGLRYYYQLPIYHLNNDDERRYLAASYETGLGTEEGKELAEDLAERFKVTVHEARRILKKGNESLVKVMTSDFTVQELRGLTEGYLPASNDDTALSERDT